VAKKGETDDKLEEYKPKKGEKGTWWQKCVAWGMGMGEDTNKSKGISGSGRGKEH
jgi:hypothetical protein